MNNQKSEIQELANNCLMMGANIDNLDNDVVVELYHLQKQLIDIVNKNLDDDNVIIRTSLCKNQDVVLNKIVEFYDDFEFENLKNIYTPAVQGHRHWQNVELMKDKGLVGYFLSKITNTKPIMMFCSNDENYNFSELLPEQELIFSNREDSLSSQYHKYLLENYDKIDILVLHGLYPETIEFLIKYRVLRPDGKVFCGLDMNSGWIENISWSSDVIRDFANNCDVITTSCISIVDMLNMRKDVSFPCYYLPNGFANITDCEVCADENVKENIFLTVGRIGTAQKNNLEMLIGFALSADKMPNWTLRLVGTIEEDFKPIINMFFEKFPYLKHRVIFTGPIYDKQELYNEYAKAKCFILTSLYEGAPNVYAEALNHGCKFIISKIDCADEMTNYGELGYTYKINDQDELANCFIKISKNSSKNDFKEHIKKAKAYAQKHYDWDKNVKKLAFMLKN